jgi:Na+-translocating ferredoxin:NAD+ oxidoreductase RnfG subunit
MKKHGIILFIACIACTATAQNNNQTSFDAIEESVREGNAAALSAFFPNTLECNLLGEEAIYSKAQATMVLKDFFAKHTPVKFTFKHSSDKQTVKYAIGTLQTQNGEKLRVTVFIKDENEALKIQQLRIEKE